MTYIARILFDLGAWLTGWLVLALPGLITKAMVFLGIGYVSYSGFDSLGSSIGVFLTNSLNGLPADMLQVLLVAGVGTGLQMVVASISAFFTIKATLGVFSAFKPTGGFRA